MRQKDKKNKMLATKVRETRNLVPGNKKKLLAKDQRVYCKENEHWVRDCPNKKKRSPPHDQTLHLFVAKSKEITKGVLTQKLSP